VTAPAQSRDTWVWAGFAVVGVAAAVLSFSALADIARLCGMVGIVPLFGVDFRLAWLLPLAVDVFAITATAIWLRRRVSDEAISYACRAAWAAIGATVVGNAYHGLLVELATPPPWVAVVIVSAVPAVALGALVHLAVLVGRPTVEPAVEDPTIEPTADEVESVEAATGVPVVPGAGATYVYRLRAADGELLYVGITQNVRNRMIRHRSDKRWWPDVEGVELAGYSRRRSRSSSTSSATSSRATTSTRARWSTARHQRATTI
jgi:hypothetical protein